MRFGAVVVLLALVTLAAGCGQGLRTDRAAAGRVFTDDLGREVRLPERVERAVSLAPSLTENIFAVGAGGRLVGVTTYCDFPEQAKSIQKIGDTQTPNLEAIIALQPQVVFVSTASQLESFMRTLDERGIAVYVMDSGSLDDVFRNILRLGEIFGTADEAGRLVNGLRERVAAVKQRAAASKPKRVFLQISNEPLFTIGRDSFLTELIAAAGGESVTKDVPTGYPKLSKETAMALDPEVIILSDSDDNRVPNVVFDRSQAVRHGAVYRIDPDIISRPGPRSVDALEEIAEVVGN